MVMRGMVQGCVASGIHRYNRCCCCCCCFCFCGGFFFGHSSSLSPLANGHSLLLAVDNPFILHKNNNHNVQRTVVVWKPRLLPPCSFFGMVGLGCALLIMCLCWLLVGWHFFPHRHPSSFSVLSPRLFQIIPASSLSLVVSMLPREIVNLHHKIVN